MILLAGMSFIVYADVKKLVLFRGDTIGLFYKVLKDEEIQAVKFNDTNYLPMITILNNENGGNLRYDDEMKKYINITAEYVFYK